MSRSLGVLTLDLVARTFAFTQGLDKAGRDADKRMKEIEARAKKFGIALGVAFVAASTAVANSLKNSIDRMDELSKAAQRAQLPTEQFSQLTYAADLADVSMQDIVTSMGRLARAQSDAERGLKTQQQAFERLGIAYENADGTLRDSIDVFRDFADVYQKFEGQPEVLAAGMQIFGRSFQNLIPLLRGGSEGLAEAADEADRLGYTISEEAGRQAEEFNDNLTRLKAVVLGLSNSIASDLLPDLVELTGGFVDSAKEGDRLASTARDISSAIRALIGWMSEGSQVGASFRKSMSDLREVIGAGAANIAGIFNLDQGQIDQSRKDFVEAGRNFWDSAVYGVEQAKKQNPLIFITADEGAIPEAAKLRRLPAPELPQLKDDKASKSKGGKSDEEREAEQLQRAYESLNASLAERIALFGQEGEAVKLRYELENGALKELDAVKKQELLTRAEQIDQMELMAELEDAAQQAVEEQTKAYEQERARAQEFVDALKEEVMWLAATTDGRYRLEAAQLAGKDATEADIEAMERLIRQRDDMVEADRNWEEINRNISDSLYEIVSGAESAEDAIKNFLDSLNRQILENITDGWADGITDWLKGFSNSSGGGGSGAGFWTNLIGSLFGGGKAAGGPFGANRIYEVNESGMEMATVRGRDYLLTGSSSGSITPAHKVGGGLQQTNNFTIQGRIDRRTEMQVAAEVGRKATVATKRNGW